MRLIGLDIGSKTVGVAVSDPLGVIAQPVETIAVDEKRDNFGMRPLRKIVSKYQADGFVLGLPKTMSGEDGRSVARSKAYGQRLVDKYGLPIYYCDERLTTVESNRILIEEAGVHDRHERKKVVDQMAAVLILQAYLDEQKKEQ